MTSVELFRQPKALPKPEVREWGTGDLQAEALDKVWVPTRPTWHHSGEDKEQKYTLTSLALSNVRMTDQLLPDPKECNMGPLMINKPFHAEHPYSSHIPRTALIPKFDSPQDPKRGVQARSQRPINSEMPACPYDVTIVSKTKGSGLRHEVQDLPRDTDKRPLVWLGEDGFNQLVKARGGRQQYYPFPPKLVAPNLQDRPADMMVSPRTADTLRNVERGQWNTTYNLTHTGLGDANAMVLDNYCAKMEKLREDGTEDDDLYPAFMPTFDPPRPMGGRIARRLASEPDPQTTEVDKAVETSRKTLNEIEEERLLNGRMYVSLPQEEDSEENNGRVPKGFPAQSAIDPTTEQSSSQQQQSYLETMKREQDQKFQQIEAQNRFKDLETRTPQNDIELLNVKYHHVKDKELPPAFYDHEAKYNEERAGLYQTSYDPYRLYNSMDEQAKSGPVLMDTMLSHVDAIHVDSDLNSQMADARLYGAVVNEQQRLTNLTPPRDIILAHEQKKQSQKEWLQPTINSARVSVEERGTVNTESTKGDSFDVVKFLQENELPKFAKRDPQRVMSHENQNLNNVRVVSTEKPVGKSVRFEDETDVQPVCRPRSRAEHPNTIQYTSRHAMWKRENECHDNAIVPVPGISDILRREKTMPCSTAVVRFSEARPTTSLGKRNDFASRSTNIAPSNLSKSFSEFSSYKNQFPVYDLDYKDDARFKWAPGHGTPRPQTTLLQIQDSFSKSQVQRRFHETFREGAPDLRHSIRAGKKHSFDGVNCQVLHG